MIGFALKLAGMMLGVLLLTQLARRLGLGGQEHIRDAEHALALAEQVSPGFAGDAVIVDSIGSAALVEGRNSALMLILTKGPRFVTREIGATTCTKVKDDVLTISIDEPDFPAATLVLGADAPVWADRLKRQTCG